MSADDKRTPPTPTHAGQSLGGLRAAANLSPEERSARAQKANRTRWARDAERRAAEGLPPRKKRPPEPSAEELAPWLEAVDRLHPGRQWPNREARRRQAIILARTAVAEAIADAFKNANEAGA